MATRQKFEVMRERLLTEKNGVTGVINSLRYLARKHPRSKKLAGVLNYFRKNKARMRYAEWKEAGFMIGSGVVEAACKTLVAQRLKLSGVRWSKDGAQAILTMRGWEQSERFDEAWALVAATYQRDVHVHVLANIIDITQRHRRKSSASTSG